METKTFVYECPTGCQKSFAMFFQGSQGTCNDKSGSQVEWFPFTCFSPDICITREQTMKQQIQYC